MQTLSVCILRMGSYAPSIIAVGISSNKTEMQVCVHYLSCTLQSSSNLVPNKHDLQAKRMDDDSNKNKETLCKSPVRLMPYKRGSSPGLSLVRTAAPTHNTCGCFYHCWFLLQEERWSMTVEELMRWHPPVLQQQGLGYCAGWRFLSLCQTI